MTPSGHSYSITTDGTAKGTTVLIDGEPLAGIARASASVKRSRHETVVNVVAWVAPSAALTKNEGPDA